MVAFFLILLLLQYFFFNFLYIEHFISKSFFALGGLFRKLVLKIGISFAATIGVRRVCASLFYARAIISFAVSGVVLFFSAHTLSF